MDMFDLKNFIVTNLVNGVKNGTFAKEYANITAVNYLAKGILAEDNIVSVNAQIEAWEAEKAIQNKIREGIADEDGIEGTVEENSEVEESIE